MAIDDPNDIPETAEACAEYLREADAAWESGVIDRACDLYRALAWSEFSSAEQSDRAHLRLGLVALNAGDRNAAWDHLSQSKDPDAKGLFATLDLSTPDRAPDINRPPASIEESEAYWQAGHKAREAKDWATSARWYEYVANFEPNPAEVRARAMVGIADALHQLGDVTNAKAWLDLAEPALIDDDMLEIARTLRETIGVSVKTGSSPAETTLENGIQDFRFGELESARDLLTTVSFLDGSNGIVIGRAAYYLGAIAYQAEDYSAARTQFRRAADNAPDPERSWAREMLAERWGE